MKLKEDIFTIGSIALLVGSFIWSVRTNHNARQLAKKLDVTIDDLSNRTDVSVEQSVISAAVDKAVNKSLSEKIETATKEASRIAAASIREEAKSCVTKAYGDVKGVVKKELMNRVKSLDISEIKDEIVDAAKEKVYERLDSDIEEIVQKHDDDLGSVSKVYKVLAKRFIDRDSDSHVIVW